MMSSQGSGLEVTLRIRLAALGVAQVFAEQAIGPKGQCNKEKDPTCGLSNCSTETAGFWGRW